MSEIADGWVLVPLGKVATTQLGRMLSARRETGAHAKPYLRNRDVQWGRININDLPMMDFTPRDSERFLLHPGDVLICEGGEVGRAAIWNGQLSECYYQKAIHRVRPSSDLLPQFLAYLMEYYSRTRSFERYTSGSTIAHLPQEDLRNLPIPLPPVAEQQKIVTVIEEQFSRLDSGLTSLERVRRNLGRMRTAVLDAAVTGRLVPPNRDPVDAAQLVAQLRKEAGAGGKRKAVQPAIEHLNSTPNSWRVVALADMAQSIDYGTSEKTSSEVEGVPVLRMSNLGRGTISYDDLKFLQHGKLKEAFFLKHGDLLFNRTNSAELVGKTAVFRGHQEDISFASYLIRVRPLPSANLEWASIVLNSTIGRRYVAAVRTQQVGQANVNGMKLAAAPIPLPPAEEQSRIIAECGRLFSMIDMLEESALVAMNRGMSLRSSVLATAFAGKIIAQDVASERPFNER